MTYPANPTPLPNGFYLFRDDTGTWLPMEVENGQQFPLYRSFHEVAGGLEVETVADFCICVVGPLLAPGAR
jgi:hypothetical protein